MQRGLLVSQIQRAINGKEERSDLRSQEAMHRYIVRSFAGGAPRWDFVELERLSSGIKFSVSKRKIG